MKNLRDLSKYFKKHKKMLYWGITFIIISNAFSVYVPVIIKDALNSLQSKIDYDVLVKYALLIVGSTIIAGIFRFFIRQTIIVVSREVEYDLRGDFWDHIQKLPLRFFQNYSTGNIMAHATNDISAVRMFVGPAVMYSIDTAIKFVVAVTIMSIISIKVTMIALLPLPFLSFLVYFVGKKIHERFTLIQEKFSDLTSKAQENFSGIRVVKSYVSEDRELESFMALSKEYLQRNMRLVKLQAFFQPILFLITGLSVIITIWFGGIEVINGQLLIGDVTALVIYLGILIWPMIAFGWVVNIIQQAEASMKRLNKIFSEPFEISDSDSTDHSITTLNGDIEFRNASFKYGENLHEVISNVNLKIPRGTKLAVMGNTGSGKTTFINFIPRLYDVTAGEVLIDGINIKNIPVSVLRSNIGYVPQEAFLFSDSIYKNITYGKPGVSEEKVMEASEISRFSKDVEQFPEGYQTLVGERGITLSGGQKQRASLARALVIDPKILILDDSFSAVDTHTEEEILTNLKSYMAGRTSIIVSHRVSTVKDLDKILVLENGKIAEQGTHDELLEFNGVYAGIYRKQLLEQEIEQLG
ncbi:MAG: ABC transporter ATP-binding protein [Ignavibacteriaceae bacterium]|nr:ABC transporter ATP-binding protein [Ignavibacteriaceae bacterium]